MKKIIRLTESDLSRIVRKVILEDKYKISKDERVVISDTENFKQIVPLTEMASCKYGGNTKWCVSGEKYNTFSFYKKNCFTVSMIMIKNPKIQEEFKTKKFSLNAYNFYIEPLNEINRLIDLKELSSKIGIYDEVKSLVDDFINYHDNNCDEKIKMKLM
jgi:hypothetical protein